VEEATQMTIEKRIRHLAVREREDGGRILGITTGTDLAKYLKQKLMNNQEAFQYLGEELSIVEALSIPEPLPSSNQDEHC
jgi:signal-transduction protein with cAMP-binding, CBS, and nucleotidyltransferase domain